MAKELMLVKTGNGFQYATDHDRDEAADIKLGRPVKVSAVRQSERSLKFHRLYFGGLLALTFDYWEPQGGMTTDAEKALITQFCKILDNAAGGTEIATWGNEFLINLGEKRAQKYQLPEKHINDLHKWVKEQAGYYDVVRTPSGPHKKLRSINFNAMDREQFKAFYQAAFNVCWRHVLANTFSNEKEAQAAVMKLLAMS